MADTVELRQLSRTDTAVVRLTCPPEEIGENMDSIFGEVMAYLDASGVAPAGVAFGRYTMRDGQSEVDIEAGFTIARPIADPALSGRIEPGELPGGEAAVCLHVGPYDQVGAAYQAVAEWVTKEKRRPVGAAWEAYLSMPGEDPSRIEVVLPLSPAAGG